MVNATPVNLVKVTCLSQGTGTLELGPALTAFRGVEALIDGKTYSYSIQQGGNYEYGRGVFAASGNTLTRGVLASSYGNAAIALVANAIVCFPALAEDLQIPGPPGAPGTPGEPGGQGPTGPQGAGINMTVIGRSGDHTVQTADANTYQRFTNATAATLSVDTNANVAIPVGTVVAIESAGAGTLAIAALSGVTINCRGGASSTAGQYAVAQLKKVDTDIWTLLGDVA